MGLIETAKFPGAVAGAADLLNLTNLYPSSTVPTLAAGISAGDTSLTVATGTGATLPSDNFVVSIGDEIMFCASRSGDTLSSLTRGVQGTVAAAHAAPAAVHQYVVALHHNQLAAEVNALESWAAWRLHPDRPPVSATAYDDEFDAGTLNTGLWSWLNQGSASAALSRSNLVLSAPSNGGANNIHAVLEGVPAGAWEFTAKVSLTWPTNAVQAGLVLRDSISARLSYVALENAAGASAVPKVRKWDFTNPTTYQAVSAQLGQYQPSTLYLRVADDTANLTWSWSVDGIAWPAGLTESRTAWLTNGPNEVGLCTDQYSADVKACFDWIRRTA